MYTTAEGYTELTTEHFYHIGTPFPHEYNIHADVVVLPLNQNRHELEVVKLFERISNFQNSNSYPLLPSSQFGRTNRESLISPIEIRDETYKFCLSQAKKLPLETIIGSRSNKPIILGAKSALLGDNNLLILHPKHSQSELTEEVIRLGDSLAQFGLIVGMNGHGNNNSKGELHIQVYDTRGTKIRYLYHRMSIVETREASVLYERLLQEGRFISIAFLGNGKVGFIEQRMPALFALQKKEFPHNIDSQLLSSFEKKYLYLRM